MSEQGNLAIEQPEVDDIGADLRRSIEELNIEREEPKARITLDKEAAPRPRDETGKFVKGEEEKPEKPKRETLTLPDKKAAPAPQEQIEEPIEQPVAPKAAVKPPPGWNNPMREKFAGLPPEIQEYISKREMDAERKITFQDEERLLGRKVNEMAMPYMPTIKAEGATVEKAFGDYLQTAHVLRAGQPSQKAQAVATVMQQFGVDPNLLFSYLQGGSVNSGAQLQPGMHNPILETLQQRLDRLEAERQADIQNRQLAEQHAFDSQIEAFASAPGHEHFEQVKYLMGSLLEGEQAEDMEDAYQKAIWSVPEIRSSLMQASQQAEQSKRISEQNARAERAKNAAISVTGAPGGSKPSAANGSVGSIRDDLRAAMDQIRGRV